MSLDSYTAQRMLMALQGKNIYQGTIDPAAVEKRRARNKVARKQRRVNRLRDA